MATSRHILRRRIRGARETAKVTRAMEMIASARMRRTEQRALDARPYATHLSELMRSVASDARVRGEHPWLHSSEARRVLVLHMTSDKGLCGGLNSKLNALLGQFIIEQGVPVDVVTIGSKGRDFAVRTRLNLVAEFSGIGDSPRIAELRPLCRLVADMFSRGEIDSVYICYSRFLSVMVQRPQIEKLLPLNETAAAPVEAREFLYEPDVDRVIDELFMRYVEASIYHAYLELVASEYSARMVAMHSATDSARELAEDMTIEMNKARQAAVTEEICDVSAGTEAMLSRGAHG
ncbi:MAG: ATP synthase F1 subunit gamma [Dehalococcoidia bacterium]|nr:ATP synthase F1 subunit gamma [Dehalococcoidia bacterium]